MKIPIAGAHLELLREFQAATNGADGVTVSLRLM
jgi:hypothetical protein